MKRNLLIVLLLVLIGGGFMFVNSNTDLFKGFLGNQVAYVPSDNEETTDETTRKLPFEDKHFIELYSQSRYQEHPECSGTYDATDAELAEKCPPIIYDIQERVQALTSLYNLEAYANFRAKKIDGKWYACEDGDYSDDCKSLEDLGYSKEFFHELFGLDPYEMPQLYYGTKNSITGGGIQMSPETMDLIQNLQNNGEESGSIYNSIQYDGVIDPTIFQSQ